MKGTTDEPDHARNVVLLVEGLEVTAGLYTHAAALLLGAAMAGLGAWQVQALRYGAQIADMRTQHASTLSDIAGKTTAAATAVRTAEQAAAAALAAADTRNHQDLSNARQENDRLRACVRAGTCGVRIIAAHSAPACSGPANASPSSLGNGAVEIDADTAQRVLDLRESIQQDAAKLAYLRDYASTCHAARAVNE